MFRLEADSDGKTTTVRLIGRIRAKHLDELREIAKGGVRAILNLSEVTLVDVETVRFFCACEDAGVHLEDCPAYIREWMHRERDDRPC
jgi:hypothetical protein